MIVGRVIQGIGFAIRYKTQTLREQHKQEANYHQANLDHDVVCLENND